MIKKIEHAVEPQNMMCFMKNVMWSAMIYHFNIGIIILKYFIIRWKANMYPFIKIKRLSGVGGGLKWLKYIYQLV